MRKAIVAAIHTGAFLCSRNIGDLSFVAPWMSVLYQIRYARQRKTISYVEAKDAAIREVNSCVMVTIGWGEWEWGNGENG